MQAVTFDSILDAIETLSIDEQTTIVESYHFAQSFKRAYLEK